jgi:hypothetical protein
MRLSRAWRPALAAVLVGLALLLASGCGSSGGGKAAVDAETAALAPKDAGLLAVIDTDRASGQWKALDALLARIPGGAGLIDRAFASLAPSGTKKLDFERDVQPALGSQAVIVLPAGETSPVILVKPDDDAKLRALIASAGGDTATGMQNGWTVLAERQENISAYDLALAKGTLDDSEELADAMDGLPAEALARVFVNGKGLQGLSGAASGALRTLEAGTFFISSTSGTPSDDKLFESLGTLGFAVSAGDHVLRLDGSLQAAAGVTPVRYEPTLLRQVPSDALAAFSFSGSPDAARRLEKTFADAGAQDALDRLPQTLGVTLDQLATLVDGEGVAYVRPGLIVPGVSVVLHPTDPARAVSVLDALAAKLAPLVGGKVGKNTQGGQTFSQVTVSILSIGWVRDGDRVMITTAPGGVDVDFVGKGPKLVDTERFKAAADDVGLGDTTGGFSYLDVKGLAPLLNTLASAAGDAASDPTFRELMDALTSIQSVAVNSSADGDRVRVQAVVRTIP